MEKTKSVGIWIRVSTEDQALGDSPEHHEKRASLYVEAKGWKVETVYHLEGVSGKTVINHPETKRMLNDIKTGKITGLVFSKLARLARNAKELMEFSEIFKTYNADLISLMESIDTSTPAGRLFYNIIAVMAQWEREEIASRVAASVPIRAKLGKPLGGAAPFGYKWDGKQLLVDEKEAPIRKQLYELFLVHKRKKTIAKILNDKGYRTRNGSKFSNATIHRLLRDPMAKGERRSNYTKSLGEKKHWTIKPESEWVMTACPAIITEDVWNRCTQLLDSQEVKRKPGRKSVQIFAGLLKCKCGGKMYVPSRTSKYVCADCKQTHIAIADIEEIYFQHLKSFLLTKKDLTTFLERANESIQNKQKELETFKKEKVRIKSEMDKIMNLHLKGEIPADGFKTYYQPLDEQSKQIENGIVETEAQLDFLKVQHLNGDHILENAETLYEKIPTLEQEEKRQVVEELTQSILIEGEDITIKFGYAPIILPIIVGNTPTCVHNNALAVIIIIPKRNVFAHPVWFKNI